MFPYASLRISCGIYTAYIAHLVHLMIFCSLPVLCDLLQPPTHVPVTILSSAPVCVAYIDHMGSLLLEIPLFQVELYSMAPYKRPRSIPNDPDSVVFDSQSVIES